MSLLGAGTPAGAVSAPSAPAHPAAREPTRPSPALTRWARVVCHLAAEIPLAVVAVVLSSRGWRPVFDDAAISWRSWAVFTRSTPLVGHMTLASGDHAVYALGPAENWLLALPVRIDPLQGALWGAALVGIVAIALAIEAAWSVAGLPGAIVASAASLVLVMNRPDLVLDPLWNPTMGLLLLLTTAAAAWATGTGRLGWWPVSVVAGTVTAQCHEFFALIAVGLVVAGLVLGLAVRHVEHRALGWRWAAVGVGLGVALWLPPVIQQLTGHPGNLGLLWRSSGRHQATLGASDALGALGAAVRPFPEWLHMLPRGRAFSSFLGTLGTFAGPRPWAVVVLVLLGVIAAAAWWAGRRSLTILAVLALVADVAAVVSVDKFPLSGFEAFSYLDGTWWVLGPLTTVVVVWAIVEVASRVVASRVVARSQGALRLRQRLDLRLGPLARLVGTAVVAAMGGVAIATLVNLSPTVFSSVGGWRMVSTVDRASTAAASVAPRHRPFVLTIEGGASSGEAFAILTGTGYQLYTSGFDPRFYSGLASRYFGPSTVANHPMPTVTVRITSSPSGARVSAVPGTRH